MLIDWFTVAAQALNFIVLVWLMKRYLYKPILHALDAREQRIAEELADADAKRAEAEKERAQFQQKNEDFDEQRKALLSEATDAAKAEGQRLKSEAREAAQALSAKRQEALSNEARHLSQAIGRRTRDEVFAVARKALADLATASLEERMSAVFTRRLQEMDGEARAQLGAALESATAPARLRSAFELLPPQQAAIKKALSSAFSADVEVRFETAPDLIGGIELATGGHKLAWTIDAYLSSLEKNVGDLLGSSSRPESNPATAPAPIGEANEQRA